jgi:lipopolysaccharide export system protein LptA
MQKRILILFVVLLLAQLVVPAQKKVKLISTDEWLYDKSLVDAQRLIGNVHLEYEGTHFYADSAYLFPNDNFDGYGQIRMSKANDYTLTGEMLHFEESTHTAVVRNQVTLQDGQMTLKTDDLTYNTRTAIATYQNGGHMRSSKDQNELTSERGSYHSKSQTFYFRKKVQLKNPDYRVYSDTLQYDERSEIAYFFGPTHIIGDSTRLYCENGYYDTRLDQSRFGQNAHVTSGKMKLRGDSIFYDGKKGLGEVFRNVAITDTTAGVQIHGQYGRHLEEPALSYVTQQAWLYQVIDQNDSLFVRADSLFLIGSDTADRVMKAHHDVTFYHHEIQGVCDSLLFFESDSLLTLHGDPKLWHGVQQMTSDTMHLTFRNGAMDKLMLYHNSFIIGQAAPHSIHASEQEHLHQIKGRHMTGTFLAGELVQLFVEGNAQLIYFPESENKEQPHLIGHNKADCSQMNIALDQQKITKIRLEQEPRSVYSPLSKVDASNFLLDGAHWDATLRPTSAQTIRTFNPNK